MEAARFFTTFVSFGPPDLEFATRLVADLKAEGVECSFYPGNYSRGERTRTEIDQSRRAAQRVIVVCSYRSLLQDGVLEEIDDQIRENPDKIIPVSLDEVWLQPGYRILWNTRDLKPFFNERNYADFHDESVYAGSLTRLLGALADRKAGDRIKNPTDSAARSTTGSALANARGRGETNSPSSLAKRLKNIEALLRLRGAANDLSFVAQILDAFAAILILKYDLADREAAEEPQVYLQLIKYLSAPTGSRLVKDLALEGTWDVQTLRQRLERTSSAVAHGDASPSTIAFVEGTLTQLYLVVASLITQQVDEHAAEVMVTAMSLEEDDHVEYKSTLRVNLKTKRIDPDMEAEVVRAIAGMANYDGGTLYIGVGDNGEILGTELDLGSFQGGNVMDKFRRHFDQLVSERIGVARYQVVEASWDTPGVEASWAEPQGKKVFVVKVKAWNRPIFVKGAGNERDFWVRRGARTLKLSTEEFYEYSRARWPSEA